MVYEKIPETGSRDTVNEKEFGRHLHDPAVGHASENGIDMSNGRIEPPVKLSAYYGAHRDRS